MVVDSKDSDTLYRSEQTQGDSQRVWSKYDTGKKMDETDTIRQRHLRHFNSSSASVELPGSSNSGFFGAKKLFQNPIDAVKQATASAFGSRKKYQNYSHSRSSSNHEYRRRNLHSLRGISCSGFMYKRVGGMSGIAATIFYQESQSMIERKMGGKVWVLRYFKLSNGLLSYFDLPKSFSECHNQLSPDNDPDGVEAFLRSSGLEGRSLDLTRAGVQIRMFCGGSALDNRDNDSKSEISSSKTLESSGEKNLTNDSASSSSSGWSPTPFQFEISCTSILRPNEWHNWTLCCRNEKELMKWVSVVAKVVYIKEIASDSAPDSESNGGMIDSCNAASAINDSPEKKAKCLFLTLKDISAALTAIHDFLLSIYSDGIATILFLVSVGFVALFLWFNQTVPIYVIFVAIISFSNFWLLWIIFGTIKRIESRSEIGSAFSSQHDNKKNSIKWREIECDEKLNGSVSVSENTLPCTPIQAGSTIPFLSQADILEADDAEHYWTVADDSVLMLRTGPNYSRFGNKAPTKPSLYKTVEVDVFESKAKIMEVLNGFVKVSSDRYAPASAVPSPFPSLLVFNFQMPFSKGSFLSATGESSTYNLVMYTTPSEDFLDMVNGRKAKDPAVPLLQRWFEDAHKENQTALKERLKVVSYVLNPSDCHMPSWSKRYNGKPVLIKRSGVISRKTTPEFSYYEVDIDMRMWSMVSRQGIRALLPSVISKMDVILSFVIEGQEDDELPERSLMAVQLSRIHPERVCKV